jgi:hypothetical protein
MVVGVGVPVFCTGLSGILKIAFCEVVREGLPSRKGPVIYEGTPLVRIYAQLVEYNTVLTLAESLSAIGVGLPLA